MKLSESFGQAVGAAEGKLHKVWDNMFPSHEERIQKAEELEQSICRNMGVEYQAPDIDGEMEA